MGPAGSRQDLLALRSARERDRRSRRAVAQVGRHPPDADSYSNADTCTNRDAKPKPRRQPGRFAIGEQLTGRIAGTDVCIPAAVAERKRVTWSPLAQSGAIPNRSTRQPFAFTIAECDAFCDGVAGEKRLSVTGQDSRRVDTDFPE